MTVRRWHILSHLVQRFGYSRYLEIGVAGGATFRSIRVADKVGVDPAFRWWYLFDRRIRRMTSDAFFRKNKKKFDLVFIDGLHTAQQTASDIRGALEVLNPGGSVLIHDCLPVSREQQLVPRMQVSWTGDVWRAFLSACQDPDLHTMVFNCDKGCGLVRKESRPIDYPKPPKEIDPMNADLTWEEFDKNRSNWMHIVAADEVFNTLDRLTEPTSGI